MKVFRISKCKYIEDVKGTGAASFPGRWHSKGTYILYTAETASLALLESIVHISNIFVTDFCMACLELPDDKILRMDIDDLPDNWNGIPPPDYLKTIGDRFIRENQFLALELPSAIIPEDKNYLLNPGHPDFTLVKIVQQRKITIDERLQKQ